MSNRECWIFSLRSLEHYITTSSGADTPFAPEEISTQYGHTLIRAYYTVGDTAQSPIVGILAGSDIDDLGSDAKIAALQRIAWVARDSQRGSAQYPASWSPYHDNDLTTFFAADRAKNSNAARLIVSVSKDSNEADLWNLAVTSQGREKNLADFREDSQIQDEVQRLQSQCKAAWNSNLAQALATLSQQGNTEAPSFARDIYQLTPPAKPENQWTFDGAIDALTPEQQEAVLSDEQQPTFLQGPAGSGKSLCLALRAIREARRNGSQKRRVLILTHSWQVAFSIDELVGLLLAREPETAHRIEITPILARAQESRARRGRDDSPTILGSDSDEGKTLQLARIADAIEEVRRNNWLALKDTTSDELRHRFDDASNPSVRRGLAWDLMIEFSDVLGANRIMPGHRALERYVQLPRTQWALPRNDGDCELILKVYESYIRQLHKDNVLSADQAISDYLGILSSYDWDARRESLGYDYVAVDEHHLFTRQEQLCLEYLTNRRDTYPPMLCARDETQTPSARYLGESASEATKRLADPDSTISIRELHVVHRFGPSTLELVKFLLRRHPSISIGHEIRIDTDALQTSKHEDDGQIEISFHETDAEVQNAINTLHPEGERRLAIIVVDSSRAHEFFEAVTLNPRCRVVRSPDDIQSASYSPRAVLVASAAEVAGLQFDDVVLVGLRDTQELPVSQQVGLMNQLYLGVTRSRGSVRFIASNELGVPEAINVAVSQGLIISS